MNKFYGMVGYGEPSEDVDDTGVWTQTITEYPYYGDVIRNTRKLESGEYLNDDISVSNSISILADDRANQHFSLIKYVEWAGAKWTVTNVEVRSPRLILTLGKVYSGEIPVPPGP